MINMSRHTERHEIIKRACVVRNNFFANLTIVRKVITYFEVTFLNQFQYYLRFSPRNILHEQIFHV